MSEDDDHHQKRRSMKNFSPIDKEICSPIGLHVLVVDNDTHFLAGLEGILRKCQYNVTTSTSVSQAISLAMENKRSFDIVMSEVYFVGEDGFKILDVVGVGLGLPVIMMSVSGETNVVMRGIKGGACNYLIKPIRMEEVRTLWQHVVRTRGRQYHHVVKLKDSHGDSSENWGVADSSESTTSKNGKQGSQIIKDIRGLKETRVNWTLELHQQFLNAVNQLGVHKVVPKIILEIMDVPGLTRDNVASHLQKYRLYLKRLRGIIPEPRPVASFQARGQGKSGGTMEIRQGKSGGTMEIPQGGKTSAVSPSSSSGPSSCLKQTHMRRLELAGRNLDQATVESLEQFRSQEQEQKLTASNSGQVLPQVVAGAADHGSDSGSEVRGMRPSFHVGCIRKNMHRAFAYSANPVEDLAARSFNPNPNPNLVEDLANTKNPPEIVDLPIHLCKLQNPSTTYEILKLDAAHNVEEAWPRDELNKMYVEDLTFNNFVEEDTDFSAAASLLSQLEYGAMVNADNLLCEPSVESNHDERLPHATTTHCYM